TAPSIAVYMAGGPSKTVTRSAATIFHALLASKLGSSASVAPDEIAGPRPYAIPNAWNNGKQLSTTSSGPMLSRLRAMTAWLLTRVVWVSWAPLGTPVVRDVYRMTALSLFARVTGQARPRKSSVSCSSVCLPRPIGRTPAVWAPAVAAGQHDSAKTNRRAPVLVKADATSRALRSGSIGTTTAPACSTP